MKVRKMVDQKKEILFYGVGTLLVLGIVIYSVTLIRVLSNKVTTVFAPPHSSGEGVIRYNFEEYQKLFPNAAPTSSQSTTPR